MQTTFVVSKDNLMIPKGKSNIELQFFDSPWERQNMYIQNEITLEKEVAKLDDIVIVMLLPGFVKGVLSFIFAYAVTLLTMKKPFGDFSPMVTEIHQIPILLAGAILGYTCYRKYREPGTSFVFEVSTSTLIFAFVSCGLSGLTGIVYGITYAFAILAGVGYRTIKQHHAEQE